MEKETDKAIDQLIDLTGCVCTVKTKIPPVSFVGPKKIYYKHLYSINYSRPTIL